MCQKRMTFVQKRILASRPDRVNQPGAGQPEIAEFVIGVLETGFRPGPGRSRKTRFPG